MKELIKKIDVSSKKEVRVIVASGKVKDFRDAVIENYGPRKNKRLDVNKASTLIVTHYVRDELKLKGKHLKIQLLTPTDKPDLYRNEKGHFVKI